jgi:hypothetical protein
MARDPRKLPALSATANPTIKTQSGTSADVQMKIESADPRMNA